MKMRLLFFSLVIPLCASAAPIHWFGGRDLDYWNEGRMVRGANTNAFVDESELLSKIPVTDSIVRSADFLPFDWNHYKNPMSPQFWDDGGNYVPPRPLRIVAAFPTNENIANYKEWQRHKNEIISNLSRVLGSAGATAQDEKQLDRNSNLQRTTAHEGPGRSTAQAPTRIVDWSKVTTTFVYRSSCPHCLRQIKIIENLRARGAKIMSLQLNSEAERPSIANSHPLSNAEAQRLNINVTPTLFLSANSKSIRIEGYATAGQLAEAAGQLF